jgi:hypothetical protein
MRMRRSGLDQDNQFNPFVSGVDEFGDPTVEEWTEPRSDHSMRPHWPAFEQVDQVCHAISD